MQDLFPAFIIANIFLFSCLHLFNSDRLLNNISIISTIYYIYIYIYIKYIYIYYIYIMYIYNIYYQPTITEFRSTVSH